MEASSLKIKKQIQKGKLKKTMKNVICRPEPIYWPLTTETEGETLTEELNKLKVDIPVFEKPKWSELSQIPKEMRQKPPPIPKVNGLIFGIAECKKAIEAKECIGILIDAEVNPKTIVQPLIDICLDKSVPVLCLKELRSTTDVNFGITTTVLGVKQNLLPDLEKKLFEISKCYGPPNDITYVVEINVDDEMNETNPNRNKLIEELKKGMACPYMYRVLKSFRAFSPTIEAKLRDKEDFIKLPNPAPNEPAGTSNSKFMKMNVKKISSNPNRRKIDKSNSKE